MLISRELLSLSVSCQYLLFGLCQELYIPKKGSQLNGLYTKHASLNCTVLGHRIREYAELLEEIHKDH